jgi:hypothetical protein
MTKNRGGRNGRVLSRLIFAGVMIAVFSPFALGQSSAYGPYEQEWTRFHPHFMGHRNKASIELQPERKEISIATVRDVERLPIEVTLKVGGSQNQFDLYLALSLEGKTEPFDEHVLFLRSDGSYSNRSQAYKPNVSLKEDRKLLVNFPIYSALLARAYTIYGVLVPPGTDPLRWQNWIQIASTTFAVTHALSQPIQVSEQGNLYVARDHTYAKPDWLPPKPMAVGPLGTNQGMYVDYQAPYRRTQPYPIVYVHG